MNKIFILLFFLAATAGLYAQTMPPVPELWNTRIHDETGKVISSGFASQLEMRLKAHEDSTGNQIAVLVINTLGGYPLEDYTLKVVEKWKLGQAKNDNGILLFVALDDRKVRIEVGEGLEGVLPDALCNQIIRNEMAPAFRQQNYEAGVAAAADAILKAIAGEYKADPVGRRKSRRGGSVLPFLIILGIIILISRLRGGGSNRGGGWSAGSGWYGGGFGGFSGGGGGGGFGGFSGGGGSFGGGGSSGSW